MIRILLLAVTISAFADASPAAQRSDAGAGATPTTSLRIANDPYRPFEFLIGEWISQEGSSTLRQSFRWGPGRSYIFYSTFTQQPGAAERLHFEGMMVWNGKSKALDFLFAVEPGSWTEERGTLHVAADGSVIREVELITPNGTVSQFRQTIRRTGPDSAVTSLMSKTADGGWQPNFPGSDRIEMSRRR